MSTQCLVKVAQSCLALQPHGPYSSWNSPSHNTGVGSFSLLQGLFPTQGSNPGLPHCRWILYQLSHKGIPFMFIDKFNECPQDLKMGVGKIIFK